MTKKPIQEFRKSLLIVRIWRKKTRSGIRHTVTIARYFRNGDTWKESTRFGRTDIPLLRLLLNEAHLWILQNSTRANRCTEGTNIEGSFEYRSNSYGHCHD